MSTPYSGGNYRAKRRNFLTRHTECAYCGQPATTVDHALPVSKFPELIHDESNWRPCCAHCNSSKRDRALPNLNPRSLKRGPATPGGKSRPFSPVVGRVGQHQPAWVVKGAQ